MKEQPWSNFHLDLSLTLTHVIVWIPGWWKHIEEYNKNTENTNLLYPVGFKLSKLYVADAALCNICGINFALQN